MMKYLVYLLTVGTLIGFDYHIAAGISWADIAWSTLLLISTIKLISHKWYFDFFSKVSSYYIPCMILVAVLNGELLNTVFINFFRNYVAGIVVYFALSNTIKSRKDIYTVLILGVMFLASFLLNYQRMMQDTFVSDLATLDFGYGRNNVAFTALLFAILFEFLYYSKLARSYILVGIVIMTMIIVFCASRYAMMMLAISYVLYRFMSNMKVRRSEIFVICAFLIIAPLIFNYIAGFVDDSFLSFSQNYLDEKMANADDDFYNMRIKAINIDPISEFYENEGITGLLIGNGIGIQHSFFSHALIVSGIIGLYIFLIGMIRIMKWSYRFKGEGFFLFILILTMYLNDFITNARFIIGVNSVFYCVLCAIVYKYILITNEENLNISK